MTSSSHGHKVFPLSWEVFHRHCQALAWRVAAQHQKTPFKGLVAVTRGGLVPAAILARELDIRLIETLCVASYDDDRTQGALRVLKGLPGEAGTGWLVVDDLVDTGETARIVRELLPKAHIATVFAKPAGQPLVDTFVAEFSQDTWIIFPWEAEE